MPLSQNKNRESRQWRTLAVYNAYRILSAGLFAGIFIYNSIIENHPQIFFTLLSCYFILGLFFLYCGQRHLFRFEHQVLFFGTVDIIFIATLLALIGNMRSGEGILLNVTVAALSILVPGRLAIFFAALASCLLLFGNSWQFLIYNQHNLNTFYYSGIYGAGFFATALTAWYLANWARASEHLAQIRSYELAGMQKINQYIVARLHSGIIYLDENKEIKLINSAAREFFNAGKRPQPMYLEQLSPALSVKFDHFFSKTLPQEAMAQTLLEDPCLRVHFFSIKVANNPMVLILLEDMTYIAQQAQQLKLASLGRFSASIAHELRNPLGVIAHAVQLLGEEGQLNAEDARLKELIINNCDRMNGVIKNVLQLSRRQKSRPELNELHSFLEQFKQNFAHNKECRLTFQVPKKKLNMVFDKSQLEQLLVILCDNAIQHGKDDHGSVDIVIKAKSSAHRIVLSVSDSGLGVPPEHSDDIFEPFFSTLRNGTGMGLFIARDLCEINQARLSLVQSNKGCTFCIIQNAAEELLI